ncbi:hypothetical protein VTN96DRAFT_5032 [Rasamsonia emersonii]
MCEDDGSSRGTIDQSDRPRSTSQDGSPLLADDGARRGGAVDPPGGKTKKDGGCDVVASSSWGGLVDDRGGASLRKIAVVGLTGGPWRLLATLGLVTFAPQSTTSRSTSLLPRRALRLPCAPFRALRCSAALARLPPASACLAGRCESRKKPRVRSTVKIATPG